MNIKTTAYASLATAALTSSIGISHAEDTVEYKGPSQFCMTATSCSTSWSVKVNPNTSDTQPDDTPTPVAEDAPSSIAIIPPTIELNKSASVNYRWSPSGQNGRVYPLQSGSQLYNKDQITIEVSTNTAGYMYLLYANSQGEVTELITASGYINNRFSAGEVRHLPNKASDGSTQHFYLDNVPGAETFQLMVSDKPLSTLIDKITHGRVHTHQLPPETKGMKIGKDTIPEVAQSNRHTLICDHKQPYCRQSFTIHHLPGVRP